MNDRLDIIRVFGPILKRFWIVGIFVALGMAYGARKSDHMLEVWESRSTIKLNDQHSALTKFLEEIESFSVIGKYTVELEVMRSDRILEKAVQRMNLPFSFFRFSQENWRDLYARPAFIAQGELREESWYDHIFPLRYLGDEQYTLQLPDGRWHPGTFGQTLKLPEMQLMLNRSANVWGRALEPGLFGFQFNSIEGLMEDFGNGDDLLIRLQDEKVAIVNFYTWDNVPERAADFANALAEAYLDDFLQTKLRNAAASRAFMDRSLAAAHAQLMEAELELAHYQANNSLYKLSPIVKERLEQMQEIEHQKLGLEFANSSLNRVWDSFAADTALADPGLVFDAVRSSPYAKSIRKLRNLKILHTRLRESIEAAHPDLEILEKQMLFLHHQLSHSIEHTLDANHKKLQLLDRQRLSFQDLLQQLPERERQWTQLKRKVQAAEARYMALLEKQVESEIGEAANDTFHQLYEKGLVPRQRLKPFREIKIGVNGLVFGILGAFLIHLWLVLSGRLRRESDLEVHLTLPVIAQVPVLSFPESLQEAGYIRLAQKYVFGGGTNQFLATITHSYAEKGAEFSLNFGHALSRLGARCLLVDMELRKPLLSQMMGAGELSGLAELALGHLSWEELIRKDEGGGPDLLPAGFLNGAVPATLLHHTRLWTALERIVQDYDFVILQIPLLDHGLEALPILKHCDAGLVVVRQHRSRLAKLKQTEEILELFLAGKGSAVFTHRGHAWWKKGRAP